MLSLSGDSPGDRDGATIVVSDPHAGGIDPDELRRARYIVAAADAKLDRAAREFETYGRGDQWLMEVGFADDFARRLDALGIQYMSGGEATAEDGCRCRVFVRRR